MYYWIFACKKKEWREYFVSIGCNLVSSFVSRTVQHHQQSAGNISGSVETAASASLCPGGVMEKRTVTTVWMKTNVSIRRYSLLSTSCAHSLFQTLLLSHITGCIHTLVFLFWVYKINRKGKAGNTFQYMRMYFNQCRAHLKQPYASALTGSQRECPSHLYQCGSGECVNPGLVCNGLTNCADSSDEGPGCSQRNCSSPSPPPCDHHCVSTPNGPVNTYLHTQQIHICLFSVRGY